MHWAEFAMSMLLATTEMLEEGGNRVIGVGHLQQALEADLSTT